MSKTIFSQARRRKRRNPLSKGRILLILLLVLLAGAAALAAASYSFLEKDPPALAINGLDQALGAESSFTVTARDPGSGLRSLRVEVRQNGAVSVLFDQTRPREQLLQTQGPARMEQEVVFDARKAGISDGRAEIKVTATDFAFWRMLSGNQAVLARAVEVDTEAPRIQVNHAQQYMSAGGSGIVVYTVSEEPVRHGVELNGRFFAGYPLRAASGGEGKLPMYVAYIGLSWDATGINESRVVAEDAAGNRGEAGFTPTFRPANNRHDRINVSDGFLKRKLPEFALHYPELTGSPLEQYLFLNREVRRRNNTAIAALCATPSPQRHWRDRFLRMAGATRARYADQRTYYYQGKAVDHQVHLGMDLASTERAEVKAANGGIVVFAGYMGIYGNMMLVDHGQGLFSLYSHLSGFDAPVGANVAKGEVIAHTGSTGMAGGDHLHFSMLVHGLFVTPVEWWDQHWIDVNINEVLSRY